jgi:hypothetical protein
MNHSKEQSFLFVYLFMVNLTMLSVVRTIHSKLTGWLKRSWPNLRYCPGNFLEGLRKTTHTSVRIFEPVTSRTQSRSANNSIVTFGQKLMVAHWVKKFPDFYGNRKFITVFTAARHWPLSTVTWIQSATSKWSLPYRFPTKILYSYFISHVHRFISQVGASFTFERKVRSCYVSL